MEQKLRIGVYGDSLMKGTLPDEQLRYHFHTDLFEAPLAGVDAEVTNKSVFGATSRKGVTLVQRDLARGHRYDWALIEYGGNDCNYDWADVAAHPEQHHDPVVLADEFRANLTTIVQMLREAGVRPIFTTLPPIDEVKYLACIDHNGASAAGVMQWLGDVRRIYRTQERYSGLVCTIAAELDVPCVDPRDRFLDGSIRARAMPRTASTCPRQAMRCFTPRSLSRYAPSLSDGQEKAADTGKTVSAAFRFLFCQARQAACVRASRRAAACASA